MGHSKTSDNSDSRIEESPRDISKSQIDQPGMKRDEPSPAKVSMPHVLGRSRSPQLCHASDDTPGTEVDCCHCSQGQPERDHWRLIVTFDGTENQFGEKVVSLCALKTDL